MKILSEYLRIKTGLPSKVICQACFNNTKNDLVSVLIVTLLEKLAEFPDFSDDFIHYNLSRAGD
jgi:hypothetical protein